MAGEKTESESIPYGLTVHYYPVPGRFKVRERRLEDGALFPVLLAWSFAAEVALEPLRSQSRHFVQSPGLLKQVGRRRDDRQMFFNFEIFISLPIQLADLKRPNRRRLAGR